MRTGRGDGERRSRRRKTAINPSALAKKDAGVAGIASYGLQ